MSIWGRDDASPGKVRFVPASQLNCRYNDGYTPDE